MKDWSRVCEILNGDQAGTGLFRTRETLRKDQLIQGNYFRIDIGVTGFCTCPSSGIQKTRKHNPKHWFSLTWLTD
jgi:hypothetical protein